MAKRRQKVTIVEEYKSESGDWHSVTIRLRNGEEWKVPPNELGPSAMEQMAILKADFRNTVVALMREFIGGGESYEDARANVSARLGLSAKSVGRYWHDWKRQNPQ